MLGRQSCDAGPGIRESGVGPMDAAIEYIPRAWAENQLE